MGHPTKKFAFEHFLRKHVSWLVIVIESGENRIEIFCQKSWTEQINSILVTWLWKMKEEPFFIPIC